MGWAIYSPEDFPRKQGDGTMADYAVAHRITIPLKAGQWTQLDEMGYRDTYITSWVNNEADTRDVFHASKDIAERICRMKGGTINERWYSVGLVYCNTDKTTPEEMKKLETLSHETNLRYRKAVVDAFDLQFRIKSQGGPGRLTPNPYEEECYEVLQIQPPEIVHRPEKMPMQPQVMIPDASAIQAMIEAEVTKRMEAMTAPKGR